MKVYGFFNRGTGFCQFIFAWAAIPCNLHREAASGERHFDNPPLGECCLISLSRHLMFSCQIDSGHNQGGTAKFKQGQALSK